MHKNDICVFNIIADDYIPQQQLFSENFKKNHPDIDIYCITLENTKFYSNLFKSIPINKINTIKNLEFLKFKYNVLEFSTAVKPYIFKYLFEKYSYEKILYFDSDIVVYNPINGIFDKLNNFEAVLTPHIRKMIKDDKLPHEIDFSKSGYFNAGFLGFKKNANTLKFLDWWMKKTEEYCYIDFDKFYFVDQRWLDYAPIFLNAHIIKEPGYNVAYFNLQEYIGKIDPKNVFFIHFSGFDKDKVSVYQNRFTSKTLNEYSSYFKEYDAKINLIKREKKHLYKYDFFDNKAKIGNNIKKIFLSNEVIEKNRLNINKPFKTKVKNSIYGFLNNESPFVPITNLARLIYLNEPFLQEKFPDVDFSRLSQSPLFLYIEWFIKDSGTELGIDKKFIVKQKNILDDIHPILKLHKSFHITNQFSRFFLRINYFLELLKIPNKEKFIKNSYLFLLERKVDQKTLKSLMKNKTKLAPFKKLLVNNIIKSEEFKKIIDSRSKEVFISLTYKILTLFT